jgi:hypothetical protein
MALTGSLEKQSYPVKIKLYFNSEIDTFHHKKEWHHNLLYDVKRDQQLG